MITGRIRIIVHGAMGRMGREVVASMSREPDMEVVGGADKAAASDRLVLDDGRALPLSKELATMLSAHPADVVVDFSVAEASIAAARTALEKGVRVVIGTTGFSQGNLDELDRLCREHHTGAFVAPNFTIGAVILVHLAKLCSRYFDHAEVIELHHEKKLDAPSGTALATAKAMCASRGGRFQRAQTQKFTLEGVRGGDVEGITVHSVRLPGLMAHQEVIFGGPGQTLTIRHDTINRECYMPGVALAVREVVKRSDLIIGLERLLGLE